MSYITNDIIVDGRTIYAGTAYGGLCVSTNGGQAWIKYNTSTSIYGSAYVLGIYHYEDKIYIGTWSRGLYILQWE